MTEGYEASIYMFSCFPCLPQYLDKAEMGNGPIMGELGRSSREGALGI